MKKKLLLTGMLICTVFCLSACGETAQSPEQTGVSEVAESIQNTEENKETAAEKSMEASDINSEDMAAGKQQVLIFYGNDNADGIIYKEVAVKEISPETLIEELAKVNIVSLDTKVISVYKDEKNEKLLHLDMSQEFGEYLSLMGTAGEYIVLGGVVDTFLDAYNCERVIITVEGKMLETGHASYEGELQFFETYKMEE